MLLFFLRVVLAVIVMLVNVAALGVEPALLITRELVGAVIYRKLTSRFDLGVTDVCRGVAPRRGVIVRVFVFAGFCLLALGVALFVSPSLRLRD